MTHEELVKDVARSLNSPAFLPDTPYMNNEHVREKLIAQARTAIATIYAAMREPSAPMIIAANDSHLLLTYGMAHDAVVAAIAASPLNPLPTPPQESPHED